MTQMTLGKLFRHHREDASLTQKELADRMGYHNSVISRVETDRQLPTPDYVQKFTDILCLTDTQRQEIEALYRPITLTKRLS